MKTLVMVVLMVAFSTTSVVFGVTTSDVKNFAGDIAPGKIEKNNQIYLLSWQGDYLRTTVGTIYCKGVTVNNLTGLDKNELSREKELPEVRLTRDGNTVVQIDLLTAK